MRLDVYLHHHGLARSRTEAADLISRGLVLLNGVVAQKVSMNISDLTKPSEIVINKTHNFVSRGAEKLEHALSSWNIEINGKICLDVGSSTGGFSDCLLQRGAKEVYAIDVGTDQCDPFLKTDHRFHLYEQTDIRKAKSMHPLLTGLTVDIIAVDVSFISLKMIIPSLITFSKPNTEFILLIKPQFEIGNTDAKHLLNKHGVVTDEHGHRVSIDAVRKACEEYGLAVTDVIQSPIKGGSGNSEFLLHAILMNVDSNQDEEDREQHTEIPNKHIKTKPVADFKEKMSVFDSFRTNLANHISPKHNSMNPNSAEKNNLNSLGNGGKNTKGKDERTMHPHHAHDPNQTPEEIMREVETNTEDIVDAIEANTKQLKSQNSLKSRLFSGMIYGLGAAIGATVLLAILIYILGFFSHIGFLTPVNDWLVEKLGGEKN